MCEVLASAPYLAAGVPGFWDEKFTPTRNGKWRTPQEHLADIGGRVSTQAAPVLVLPGWQDMESIKLDTLGWARPPFEECWVEIDHPDTFKARSAYVTTRTEDDGTIRVRGEVFIRGVDPSRPTAIGHFLYGIAPDGDFLPIGKIGHPYHTGAPNFDYPAETENILGWTACWIARAFTMLNCRNVELIDGGRTSEGISKRQLREKGRSDVRYKVLKIELSRDRIVILQPCAVGESAMLPRHVVRGHFRTYTAEAPLFGKHVGRWWWAAHARGDATNGEVVKDYEVTEATG